MKIKSNLVFSLLLNLILVGNVLSDEMDHHVDNNFDFSSFIVPLGIISLISIAITVVMGLLIKKNRGVLLPWHKRLAFLTLILASIHGVIVIIFHYF